MPFYTLKKAWGTHAVGQSVEVKDEGTAQLLVDAGYADKAADASVADAVTKAVMEKVSAGLSEQAAAAIQKAFSGLSIVPESGRPLVVGGAQDVADKTKSFGDFLGCVIKRDDERLTKVYQTKAPLFEGTGTGGGYLVPPDYQAVLLRLAGEKAIVRPRARIVPMGTRTIQVPALKQSGAGVAGQFQVLGGMYATWTEEAQGRVETEPQFRQVELVAHELSGYSVASRTLMADSAVALDALLTQMFADTITYHEDYAFLQGDGLGKPLGIFKAGMTITGGPTGGTSRTSANHFKLADAAWMWAQLLPSAQDTAIWMMSQSVLPELLQLADAANNTVFLPNFYEPRDMTDGRAGAQARIVPVLFGRPIVFTEKLPPLGTTGDVSLVDWSYYLLGDRQAIEVAASEHVNFLNNQMTWRFIHRVDGQPWLDAPYHYQDGSTQVSPAVVLHS